MKENLFDLALEIRTLRYIQTGLRGIADSTVFPVLPINIQQKVGKKISEYALLEKKACAKWPDDPKILTQLIDHLGEDHPYPEDEPDIEFVTKTTRVIRQYVKQSLGQVQEVLTNLNLDPEEEILDLGTIEAPEEHLRPKAMKPPVKKTRGKA